MRVTISISHSGNSVHMFASKMTLPVLQQTPIPGIDHKLLHKTAVEQCHFALALQLFGSLNQRDATMEQVGESNGAAAVHIRAVNKDTSPSDVCRPMCEGYNNCH